MRNHEGKTSVLRLRRRRRPYSDSARDAHAPPCDLQDAGIQLRACSGSHALAPTHHSYTGCTTVTIDLPEHALARLRAQAKRRGVSINVVIAELAEALPSEAGSATRTLSFVRLGSSTSGRYARDTDDLLADGFGRGRRRNWRRLQTPVNSPSAISNSRYTDDCANARASCSAAAPATSAGSSAIAPAPSATGHELPSSHTSIVATAIATMAATPIWKA
jgi:hypothetical protein